MTHRTPEKQKPAGRRAFEGQLSSLRKMRRALRPYVNALWKHAQQPFNHCLPQVITASPRLVIDPEHGLYAQGVPGEARPRDGGVILPHPITGEPEFHSVISRRASS
jgi:hypothetical protein